MAHEESLEFGRDFQRGRPHAVEQGDQGQITHWVDVGCPSAARLHRASKKAGKVSVYTDKNAAALQKEGQGHRIHRSEDIDLVLFDPALTEALAAGVDRQNHWIVTLNEGHLSVAVDDKSVDGEPAKTTIAAFLAR